MAKKMLKAKEIERLENTSAAVIVTFDAAAITRTTWCPDPTDVTCCGANTCRLTQ